uniref:Putative conserved secreted protein n=1 Tax=Xenopsylla cheopis TaxID=163159 RepID=A0A6M2DYH6_XENCH
MTTRNVIIPSRTLISVGILILILYRIQQGECLAETFNLCCSLGEKWADTGKACKSFPPPAKGVALEQQPVCLATVEICCSRRRRAAQCEAGQRAAKHNKDCHVPGAADDFYKDCCEACKIGLLVGSMGTGCKQGFSFGAGTDSSFSACCEEVVQNLTSSHTSTYAPQSIAVANKPMAEAANDLSPLDLGNLCDMLPGELCAHICTPVPGSFVCECKPGFSLMSDGKSCQKRELPDRCVESNPCSQKCLDTGYSIACSCERGYELMQDKVTCADVDECSRNMHDCPMNKTCVNTIGGYTCQQYGKGTGASEKREVRCPDGFQYNAASQVCDDIDECRLKIVKCANCQNTIGSYTCVEEGPTALCPKGYKYNEIHLTCIDVDECTEGIDDCNRQSQFCLNTLGSFKCQNKASKNSCPAGFKINSELGTCEDIDECMVQINDAGICADNEICINEPGQYRCVAYQGPQQESLSARIPENEIPHHYDTTQDLGVSPIVSTIVTEESSSMRQQPMSTHPRETVEVSSESPSQTNSAATSSTQQTAPIFVPVSVTSTTSTTTPKSVNVTCKAGYRQHPLSNACIDINECSERKHTCDSTQDCINLPGSYACQCKTGYTLDHVTQGCVDINECLTRRHACLESQRCDNTIGSYQCIRYINCGTGYTLNAATGGCEDDDECALGLHDCHRLGPQYRCRNIQGSYRCERKRPSVSTTLRPVASVRNSATLKAANDMPQAQPTYQQQTTAPSYISQYVPPQRPRCPAGYERSRDICVDINECERKNVCPRFQHCVNTMGSYNCINSIKCRHGFKLNEDNQCQDIDECSEGLHECTVGQLCKNRAGSYVCHCPPGHYMTKDKKCEDINECEKYGSRICHKAVCRNTIGSFHCDCKAGYRSREDGQRCVDIDECAETPGLCQHKCHNLWGGYRCSCQAGFKLHSNNRSCVDIDECEEFKDRYLCIGICKNTPGSYECQCPSGYKLGPDGRTCQDIDECTLEQPCDTNSVCINTRVSCQCYSIQCPPNYVKDRKKYDFDPNY